MDTSVVIITRDELPLLQDTLAVLGQTLGDEAGEYIVVDDGSQDGTAAWLAAVDAVRLIHHAEKKGWMASLNEGIANSTRLPSPRLLLRWSASISRRWTGRSGAIGSLPS